MEGFAIESASLDGVCTLSLAGELDAASAPRLNVAIDAAMKANPSKLVLDLAEVSFIDSSGLNSFVWAKRRRDGVSFVLRRPSPQCRQVLELTKLDAEFEITD